MLYCFSWAFDDLLLSLQEAFWFGWGDDMFFWILLGSPWVFDGIRANALFFLLSFLFFFLFFLVYFSNGALCPFKLVFQLSDRCDLKSSRLRIWFWSRLKKLAVILSVCVVRVGSDVFESAQLMLRADSLYAESARLSVHTWALLIELARLNSSRLERPVTIRSFWLSQLLDPRVSSSTCVFWTFLGVPWSSRLYYHSSRLEYISSENWKYNSINLPDLTLFAPMTS